jgi:alpha-aminoadipic semialdehyde synthase
MYQAEETTFCPKCAVIVLKHGHFFLFFFLKSKLSPSKCNIRMLRRSVCRSAIAGNGIIGVRREDKNVWERRVPLTPKHVEQLLQHGVVKKVIVQPSTIRCYDDRAFAEAGAEIKEDLSEAATICAVKEVPGQLLIPERSYMFFSHTIKAQSYNMPLLDTILQKNVRLFDYERIVNADGRMVKFGPYAGFAGMIDTLHALGLALLTRGYATPFLHLSMSKEYSSLDVARADLREIGEQIRKRGLPSECCPLTIAITGAGSVSNAAQQILHLLPCKYVEVEDLPKIWNQRTKDHHHVYVVVVRSKDMVVPIDPAGRFSSKDYYQNPNNYKPIFHEKVAPYIRCLVNGMYWEPRFPRLLTTTQARELAKDNRFPLLALGEITCDVGGSIEFFVKATTIQNPFYVYDIQTDAVMEMHQFDGKGVIILGVDHIPAEFPKESSTDFGDGLVPLIERVAVSDGSASLDQQSEQMGPEIFNSMITCKGQLTPNFKYIETLRAQKESQAESTRKVLVFGGGMTSGPCVRHLLQDSRNIVTLVDKDQSNLNKVAATFGKTLGLEDGSGGLRHAVADAGKVDSYIASLIKASDVVVSMLPATMHAKIAETAIACKVPMVTASYVAPEMEKLRKQAEAQNVVIVNEMGLDPGIDIMTTAKMLDEIRRDGGVVTSYVSLCGALPQPENSDGPMGYKFSWSPRGVLSAATRPARFFAGKQWHEIPGDLLYHFIQPLVGFKGLDLNWIPNGDAERYLNSYHLGGPEVDTIIRGTLRYSAFAPVIYALRPLGMLDAATPVEELTMKSPKFLSYPSLLMRLIGSSSREQLVKDLAAFLTKRISEDRARAHATETWRALQHVKMSSDVSPSALVTLEREVSIIMSTFARLGLLDENAIVPKSNDGFVIDSLCTTLQALMGYRSHERDFTMMIHRIRAFFPKSGKNKVYKATLSLRGHDLANTATAITVGLPVGATAQLILNNGLAGKCGLISPTDERVYRPILAELDRQGIRMHEECREE